MTVFIQKTLSIITVFAVVLGGFGAPSALVMAEEVSTDPAPVVTEPIAPVEEVVVPVVESTETVEEVVPSTEETVPPTEEETIPPTEEVVAEPVSTTTPETEVLPSTPTSTEEVAPESDSTEPDASSTTDTETALPEGSSARESFMPISLFSLISECVPETEGDWSDNLVSYDQGKRLNGTAVLAERSIPEAGLSNIAIASSTGFFSLGFNGSIVVSFNNFVPDIAGIDLIIFETTNLPYPVETALVEVSKDGSTWVTIGSATEPGASYFDLATVGLDWIKFVRVTDTTNKDLFADYPDADGFDLSAVRATQSICELPQEPTYVVSGYKWNDLDADGVWDEGEPTLADWTIVATEYADTSSPATYTTETDSEGYYSFELTAGTWHIAEENQKGWEQTAPVDPEYCSVSVGEEIVLEARVSGDTCNFGNHKIPVAQCVANLNLIQNGSFETPDLPADGYGWDIFDSALSGLAWIVEWLNLSEGSPVPAKLELQSGFYAASNGAQYAELDSNWNPAPGGPYYGEDARVRVHQTITTVPGATYTVSYDFSPLPRHGTSTNVLSVLLDGTQVALHSADGTGLTDTAWQTHTYTFVATGTTAIVAFADAGTADSFGTLLDNVIVNCVPEVDEEEEVIEEETDGSSSSGSRGGRRNTKVTTPIPGPTPTVLGDQVSVIPQGAPGAGHGGTAIPVGSSLSIYQLLASPRSVRFIK